MRSIIKYHFEFEDVLLLLLLVGFVVFKAPYLNLPFYWDEAWVYGPAVRTMEESGPCLLPGCVSQWLTTGHPLMFYFLASSWLKFFGTSTFVAHLFTLFVSLLTLFALYNLGALLKDKKVGLLAVGLVMTTPIFAAQSGVLVPEVLLTLFTILSLHFYLKKQFWKYFLFTVLALYTKESALVLVCATTGHNFLFNPFKKLKGRWLGTLAIFSPFLAGAVFYVLQYFISGWFFFPRHLNWVDLTYENVLYKFEFAYLFVFEEQGRLWIKNAGLIGLAIFILKSNIFAFSKEFFSKLGVLILFVFGFLAFCSLNYLSQRYMLSMIPVFILVASWFLIEAFAINKVALIAVLLIMIGLNSYSLMENRKTAYVHDISLGYKDMVEVHVDMVNYLKENKYQDKEIRTHGLVFTALKEPYAGYLSREESNKFKTVNSCEPEDAEFVINSVMEQDDVNLMKLDFDSMTLIKEFKKGNGWCKLWRQNGPQSKLE